MLITSRPSGSKSWTKRRSLKGTNLKAELLKCVTKLSHWILQVHYRVSLDGTWKGDISTTIYSMTRISPTLVRETFQFWFSSHQLFQFHWEYRRTLCLKGMSSIISSGKEKWSSSQWTTFFATASFLKIVTIVTAWNLLPSGIPKLTKMQWLSSLKTIFWL